MKRDIHSFGKIFKQSRIKKGLTQEALGRLIGVPQSHISKLESGVVDMQVSTLVEIAGILDLEIMLVSRKLVRTVQALDRGIDVHSQASRPMYTLDECANDE